MNLSDIMTPELSICQCDDHTKTQVLKHISQLISDADDRIKYQEVLDALLQRERLGSTALGHGVAIPHARISNLTNSLCVTLTLKEAVFFDDDKTQAVDLVFGLLVPENADDTHLQALSTLAEQVKNKAYREKLRAAATHFELYKAATQQG